MKLKFALTTGLLGAALATGSIAQVAGPPPVRQTGTDQQLLDATGAARVQRSGPPSGLTVEYTPGPKAPRAATGVKSSAQVDGRRSIACSGANAQASAACKATPNVD